MTAPCPLLTRKINVLGRVEVNPGTVETLTADDGKIRVYAGATPEYISNREKRDVARATLTNIGSLESTKQINNAFRVEANTRDTIQILSDKGIDTIDFQSALAGGAGSIQRIKFNGVEDLSNIVPGMYLDINYATNSSNNGSFLITLVNDGADEIDYVNRVRIDNTDDEATDSPAVGDVLSPLEFMWAINGCLAIVKGATRLAIGAITGSGFTRNETVTGTGGGTARVIQPAETGDTHIYVEPLTGLLLSGDVLTGGTSSSTATTSSGPVLNGHFVRPVSGDNCDAEVVTIEHQNDGFFFKARSANGNMTFEAGANKAMFLDFAFQGPKDSFGDKAMTVITRDEEDPPIVKNAELKLDAFSPVFSMLTFDMGNNVILRENGNASGDSGFETARITDRTPKITLSCELELKATFDFFDKLDKGTKVALQMKVGSVNEKEIWYFADFLEFDDIPNVDNNGISSLEVSADCTGKANGANDEWEFLFK